MMPPAASTATIAPMRIHYFLLLGAAPYDCGGGP
jgi:hypothetical protein